MDTFYSLASKRKVLAINEDLVKDMWRLLLDTNMSEGMVKLHRVPFFVPDNFVRTDS